MRFHPSFPDSARTQTVDIFERYRQARLGDERARVASLTDDEREAYEERVAICVHCGKLSEQEAKQIAWQGVEKSRARDLGTTISREETT